LPRWSKRAGVMAQIVASAVEKFEAIQLTRIRSCEQNTAICSLIIAATTATSSLACRCSHFPSTTGTGSPAFRQKAAKRGSVQ
jgi:hypothetical protein